ncbi:hypothetical protein [Nakamurella endophytica]|uniref:Uncharacterized protein n=1 Tax=Nakamurella endophytica TaxID=1748367 RepID=A0A917TCL9_9ACTN|nr:hypothetical protein [Nakamurella endophytica]GGM17345.1 hypothetical protein GCM10011594_41770 [Nakamurella endophytica]
MTQVSGAGMASGGSGASSGSAAPHTGTDVGRGVVGIWPYRGGRLSTTVEEAACAVDQAEPVEVADNTDVTSEGSVPLPLVHDGTNSATATTAAAAVAGRSRPGTQHLRFMVFAT